MISLLCLALAAPVWRVPVQGTLTDASGAPLNGTQALTWTLYPDATGTTPLLSGTTPVVLIDGLFQLEISAEPSDNLPHLGAGDPHLTMTVGGVESARVRVTEAPRATWSRDADRLDGLDSSAFMAASWRPEWSDITGTLGALTATGAVSAASLSATGAVSGASGAFTSGLTAGGFALPGGSPAFSVSGAGALAAASLSSTGAVSGSTGAFTGALTASGFALPGGSPAFSVSGAGAVGAASVSSAGAVVGATFANAASSPTFSVSPSGVITAAGLIVPSVASSGSVTIGGGATTCDSTTRGQVKFDGTSFFGCAASGWIQFGAAAPAGTDELFIPSGRNGNLLYQASFDNGLLRTAGAWTATAVGAGPDIVVGGLDNVGFFASGFTTSRYIDIPDTLVGGAGSQFTFVAWYRGSQNSTTSDGWDCGVPIYGDPANSVYIGLGLDNGKIAICHSTGTRRGATTLSDSTWTFLAWVRRTNNTWDAYIGRGATVSKEITAQSFTTNPSNQYFRTVGYGYPYAGMTPPSALDGLQAYDVAFTDAEIQAVYAAGRGL